MKIKSLIRFLILAFAMALAGCGPATLASNSLAGTWTSNLGMVNFIQNGNQVTGSIEGYGGFWNETFAGVVNEKGEVVFDTDVLGGFTLVFEGDMFKSASSELSFCGVRGANMELPAGCGFSGKWIVPSKSVFLPGSYMLLTQVGESITGDIHDGNDKIYDSFTGTMDWGKGWRANGESAQRGELSLWINAAETGFEFIYGSSPNNQELCAVREGLDNAYLSSYYCQP